MLRNIIDEIKLAEQKAYEIRKGAESDAQSSVDAAKNEAKKIYNDANIDTFSPDSLNAFISISEKDKSKPLAAKGGVLLNQALSNKLSISGSSTSVSTPITFTSKVKVNNPSENSDAVNLQYLKSYV
jgi:hypothetical protein